MDVARQLRPLQHGTPCETQAKKKAKTTASDVAMQNVTDREVDSSPNGSVALIRKPHLARRLPARCMLRMLTLILKTLKTITTLPLESFLLPWSRVALPTDIALWRNCLRRNGSLRPGHSPGWRSPLGIWRSKRHPCGMEPNEYALEARISVFLATMSLLGCSIIGETGETGNYQPIGWSLLFLFPNCFEPAWKHATAPCRWPAPRTSERVKQHLFRWPTLSLDEKGHARKVLWQFQQDKWPCIVVNAWPFF